jgi:hypothetical protein
LCAILACSRGEPAPQPDVAAERRQVAQATAAKVQTPKPAPSPYDKLGNLLPSGAQIDWLELPRGAERSDVSHGEDYVYEARGIPLDRVLAFFGARLLPSKVERLGEGNLFAQAMPPSGDKNAVRMDVTVVSGSEPGAVRIHIHRRVQGHVLPKFTPDDARSVLAKERRNAE